MNRNAAGATGLPSAGAPDDVIDWLWFARLSEVRNLCREEWRTIWRVIDCHGSEHDALEAKRQLVATSFGADPEFQHRLLYEKDPLVLCLWCAFHAEEDLLLSLQRLRRVDSALHDQLLQWRPDMEHTLQQITEGTE